MRVVSLLPAATEWAAACGGTSLLVGRSHACDVPAGLRDLPALTRPARTIRGADDDSAAIDRAVRDRARAGLSLFEVDWSRLRALAPDLILTQVQCEVCAVTASEVEQQLAAEGLRETQLLSVAPSTLKEVMDAGLRIGRALGRLPAAMAFVGEGEQRLRRLHERLGLRRNADPSGRPTVACVEWLAPLMTAGHWMPDVVEQAGGRPVLATSGADSARVTWDDLRHADPDVLLVAPCGFDLEATRRDLHYLTDRPGWDDLAAVREGRVVLVDGGAYVSRPGPRLYRTVELVAAAIHGVDVGAEAWEAERLGAQPGG